MFLYTELCVKGLTLISILLDKMCIADIGQFALSFEEFASLSEHSVVDFW